jgi:hypothetical protein
MAPALLVLPAVLAGCAGNSEAARGLAEQSCRYPAPDAPNFDPQLASLVLLGELSTAARERSRLADQAAEGDDRWVPMADAARALAAYADTILTIRQSGGVVADELPPAVWDQVKYASDAFILECRPALAESSG